MSHENRSIVFIINILPYRQNIHIKLKKKDEAREPKEANKACV